MIDVNIAEFARQNPDIALDVYNHTEAAVQELLPGSEYHPRYEYVTEVGLAVLVAGDHLVPEQLSPLESDSINHLAFLGYNAMDHPDAWLWALGMSEMLGGDPADNIGRFTAFALAKAKNLSDNPGAGSSYDKGRLTISAGQVGLAGARRIGNQTVSTSGQLEVHDDSISLLYARELLRSARQRSYRSSVDEITTTLKGAFDNLQAKFPEVVDITPENRSKLKRMLIANQIYIDVDAA